jgi:hypothetical protein
MLSKPGERLGAIDGIVRVEERWERRPVESSHPRFQIGAAAVEANDAD